MFDGVRLHHANLQLGEFEIAIREHYLSNWTDGALFGSDAKINLCYNFRKKLKIEVKRMSQNLFKWKYFQSDIIMVCVH
ncbi:MAG: hypothetical protein H6Q68_3451 [Firmicutes bacterium]|nr:hypothetical protein [Bacillota bacterium]